MINSAVLTGLDPGAQIFYQFGDAGSCGAGAGGGAAGAACEPAAWSAVHSAFGPPVSRAVAEAAPNASAAPAPATAAPGGGSQRRLLAASGGGGPVATAREVANFFVVPRRSAGGGWARPPPSISGAASPQRGSPAPDHPRTAVAPPAPVASADRVRFLAVGDMGTSDPDGSNIPANVPTATSPKSEYLNDASLNTTRRLLADVEGWGASMVLHNGDISYARGCEEWLSRFLSLCCCTSRKRIEDAGNAKHTRKPSADAFVPARQQARSAVGSLLRPGGASRDARAPDVHDRQPRVQLARTRGQVERLPNGQRRGVRGAVREAVPHARRRGRANWPSLLLAAFVLSLLLPAFGFHPAAPRCPHAFLPTPTRRLQPSPSLSAEGKPWYSFQWGPVHLTLLSTEHSTAAGSEQRAWLERDLAAVNRRRGSEQRARARVPAAAGRRRLCADRRRRSRLVVQARFSRLRSQICCPDAAVAFVVTQRHAVAGRGGPSHLLRRLPL